MKRPFRLGLSTLGCPTFSLDEVLALAAGQGIAAVELRALEGTMDLPALFARHGLEALRAVQGRHGAVQVLAFSTSFKLVHSCEADRAALLAFVPWAEALGVPWLRVFDGGEASDNETVSQATETFHWWRELRDRQGWKVDIMVETHDGLVTSEAIGRFCTEATSVAILWDAHNTWRKTGTAPLELWPHIAEHVMHIHVKDSVSRPSDGLPYSFVLPGKGEFPMKPLVDALKRDGYTKAVSLEWELQWHAELPSLELALQAANRGWW